MSVDIYAAQTTDDGIIEPVYEHLDAHRVNMSNSNAFHVLGILGINPGEEGMCGTMPAADFLDRITEARTRVDDVELDTHFGYVTFPGASSRAYLKDRLDRLEAVARVARDHGHLVTWN